MLDAGNLDQLDVESLIKLAEQHVGCEDVATAIAVLDRAALLEPLDAKTAEKRACWKYDIDDYSGAVADLDTAILLGTGNSLVYMNRGVAKLQLGHYEAALADFDQAVAKQTNSTDIFGTLLCKARAKHSLGHFEDALVVWGAAEQIQPLSVDELVRRFECHQQLADTRGASEQTTNTRNDLSTADSLDRMAQVYMLLCKYRSALPSLHALMGIDSKGESENGSHCS